MSGIKKLVGAYLVVVGVAVAAFFILNSLLQDSIDVPSNLASLGHPDVHRTCSRTDLQLHSQARGGDRRWERFSIAPIP